MSTNGGPPTPLLAQEVSMERSLTYFGQDAWRTSNGDLGADHNGGAVNGNGHAPVEPRLGSFQATSDYDALFDMDAVIICVPTPLSTTKDPDMSFIIGARDEIARLHHHDILIVLESTTYPGTTEEIMLPFAAGQN
ncbi:MAG: hypothetical protein R2911_01410 [Caldilineaceae bacterium]